MMIPRKAGARRALGSLITFRSGLFL